MDFYRQCFAVSSCAVPGTMVRTSHNNTIRTVERSLLAADTDGYADTESGTSSRCAVRVPKGYRQRLECARYSLTQSLSGRSLGGLDRAAALPGQQAAVGAMASCRRARRTRSEGPTSDSVGRSYKIAPQNKNNLKLKKNSENRLLLGESRRIRTQNIRIPLFCYSILK